MAASAPPVHITPHAAERMPSVHGGAVYQRLGWTALIYAGVYFTVHVVARITGAYQTLDGFSATFSTVTAAVCVALSLGVFALVRSRVLSPEAMINFGLIYEVLGAFGIDIYRVWIEVPPEAQGSGLSWVAVWVVFFVLVVPTTPGKTLAGALAAASMTPLTIVLGIARGVTSMSVPVFVLTIFPNYVCVAIAVFSAHIIYKMSREVSEARAMGSYRLVEQLGHGGMGEVWRAEHQRLARPAAIKLIRPSIMGEQQDASIIFQRFEREAQATAALESPNTVTLFDYGISDDGSFYYVMELLRGLDLKRLVSRFGPVSAERAVFLLRQVCHSLQEAHEKGLIHRDIKPANIYVCRVGQDYDFVKVLDFGLVKPVGPAGKDLGLTQAGTATGTPAYMAPELALAKPDIDARVDTYSLGCVAYWLLTGKLVFQARSPVEMAMHHVQTPPVPPSQVTEMRIPERLEQVVLACLAKQPSDRPCSMEQLSIMLAESVPPEWSRRSAREWWRTNLPEFCG